MGKRRLALFCSFWLELAGFGGIVTASFARYLSRPSQCLYGGDFCLAPLA